MRNVTRWAWIGLVMVAACGKTGAGVDTEGDDTEAVSGEEAAESPKTPVELSVAPPIRMQTTAPRVGQVRPGEPFQLTESEPVEEREISLLDAPLRVRDAAPAGVVKEPIGLHRYLPKNDMPQPPPGTCQYNVTNQGGRVIAAPKIHRVFWGSYWTQSAHTAEATALDSTWTRLANSPALFSRLSEYGVGVGSAGVRIDIGTGSTGNVAESTFRSSLQTAIVNAGIVPNNNDVFVIFLPTGTASIDDINDSAGGHHQSFSAFISGATRDVVYAIIEPLNTTDKVNEATGHEIAEAATDPDPSTGSAWWDMTAPGEIGDLCSGKNRKIAGTLLETTWSQKACRCVGARDLNGMDYDGEGSPNLTIFRSGQWWSAGAPYYWNFGQAGDVPVPGDYNGDGRTELTLFRASTHNMFVLDTTSGYYTPYYFGDPGDIAAPADYDGDGKTDLAVFRPSNGTWYVVNSSTGSMSTTQWGQAGDQPIPADYDGDGRDDFAVHRPSNSSWYVALANGSGSLWAGWGASSDVPVTGDFNGDGKADWAFYRASEGRFYISYMDSGSAYTVNWGTVGDIPVPRDYDADWKTDVAVWRPSDGTWYIVKSTTGGTSTQWGTNGDIPAMRMPQ